MAKALLLFAATLASVAGPGCSSGAGAGHLENVGTAGLRLEVAPGVSIRSVSFTVHNAALLPADRTGLVDVTNSQSLAFVIGGLPAGPGYAITLTATTEGPSPLVCTGTATFDVVANVTTSVGISLVCVSAVTADAGSNSGSVAVDGSAGLETPCPAVTSLSALPAEVDVGSPLSLSAVGAIGRAGGPGVAFSWAVTGGTGAGSFSSASSASPLFTCTAAGVVAVTATVTSTGSTACAPSSASVQVKCDAPAATAVSLGPDHSCALLSSGTVACWGSNVGGQLGAGTMTDSPTPIAVSSLGGVTALASGNAHTCALRSDGTVSCWGAQAQLGNGLATGPDNCGFPCTTTPVPIPGLSGVTAISAGLAHTCALISDGTVACWGDDGSGQLGDGAQVARLTPAVIPGLTGVTALTSGDTHTCALLTDGTIRCWGFNYSGQLGNGVLGPERCSGYPCSTRPVVVLGLAGVQAIAAGGSRTCALLGDGTARCWGFNDVGELGNGTTFSSSTPVSVSNLRGATALFAGAFHTCARLADGTVQCWGDNSAGELCNGTMTSATVAVEAPGLTGATSLAGGNDDTCAVLAGGAVRCCGFNARGQLGDGTQTNSSTPVPVVF